MVTVQLVDGRRLVRIGLRVLIDREHDMRVSGEADTGRRALDQLRRAPVDVMLLDPRMPDMGGTEVLRRLAADPALRRVRVIVVTTAGTDRCVVEALGAGAAGFVRGDGAPAELAHAIRVVAAGEALPSPAVTRRMVSAFARGRVAPAAVDGLDALTDREREIAAWVATGRSNDEIAAELFLSPATVRGHVAGAMGKLDARSRAQLVVLAVRAGLTVSGTTILPAGPRSGPA